MESRCSYFYRKLEASTPDKCTLWEYSIEGGGYPLFLHFGEQVAAHVKALEIHTGERANGRLACHGPCHNKACFNPYHLNWGDRFTNQKDRVRDRTSNRGHKGLAKLTPKKVIKIFKSNKSNAKLALKHNVSRQAIYDIKSRRNWTWLTRYLD